MAIELKSTRGLTANGVKMLVYGQAGAGKTSLVTTLPEPVVLSAEGGLLSIAHHDIPYITIKTLDDLYQAYDWLVNSDEAKRFQSVALDSISEVAEVVLDHELNQIINGKKVDGRMAYGELNTKMASLIRAFRDLPGKHVYMSAKLEKSQDEMGRMLYGPSMPGKSLTQQLPYFFDFVFPLRVEKDANGNTQRAIMTDSDGLWQAKSRGQGLSVWEAPDLGAIIQKIGGGNDQH